LGHFGAKTRLSTFVSKTGLFEKVDENGRDSSRINKNQSLRKKNLKNLTPDKYYVFISLKSEATENQKHFH